jgi:hypothetical protein
VQQFVQHLWVALLIAVHNGDGIVNGVEAEELIYRFHSKQPGHPKVLLSDEHLNSGSRPSTGQVPPEHSWNASRPHTAATLRPSSRPSRPLTSRSNKGNDLDNMEIPSRFFGRSALSKMVAKSRPMTAAGAVPAGSALSRLGSAATCRPATSGSRTINSRPATSSWLPRLVGEMTGASAHLSSFPFQEIRPYSPWVAVVGNVAAGDASEV